MFCSSLPEFGEALQIEHGDRIGLVPQWLFDCITLPLLVHEGASFCGSLGKEVISAYLFEMLRSQAMELRL